MKPEERANIMKTLKELTEKIAQLQNEMNPAKPNHNQSKTKTDVSLGRPTGCTIHFNSTQSNQEGSKILAHIKGQRSLHCFDCASVYSVNKTISHLII